MKKSKVTNQLVRLAILAILALGSLPMKTSAQVSFGADIVSRYVWRGIDFGESLTIQPALTFSGGGFDIGAWASYSVSADGSGANESDLWASYSFTTESGAGFSFGLTDYYFPAPTREADHGFFNPDFHIFEAFASVTGSEAFPVTFFAGYTIDSDSELYLEASVPFQVKEVEMSVHAGYVTEASNLHILSGLTNLGISAAKSFEISESFAPGFTVSYIVNAAAKRSFLVAGLSL